MTSFFLERLSVITNPLKLFAYVWPELAVVILSFPFGPLSGMGRGEMLRLSLLLIGQNISFTLVSRARQMASIKFHALAALGSNGFYIFVITTVVAHYNNPWLKVWYVVCTVVGSVHAHHFALHKIEKTKMFKKDSLVPRAEFDQEISSLREEIASLRGLLSGGANV